MSGVRTGDTATEWTEEHHRAQRWLAKWIGRREAASRICVEKLVELLREDSARVDWLGGDWSRLLAVHALLSGENALPNMRAAIDHAMTIEVCSVDPAVADLAAEVRGLRPSDSKAIDAALVAQLARDILTAIESHDTHRMQHIEQYARRIVRVAGGT